MGRLGQSTTSRQSSLAGPSGPVVVIDDEDEQPHAAASPKLPHSTGGALVHSERGRADVVQAQLSNGEGLPTRTLGAAHRGTGQLLWGGQLKEVSAAEGEAQVSILDGGGESHDSIDTGNDDDEVQAARCEGEAGTRMGRLQQGWGSVQGTPAARLQSLPSPGHTTLHTIGVGPGGTAACRAPAPPTVQLGLGQQGSKGAAHVAGELPAAGAQQQQQQQEGGARGRQPQYWWHLLEDFVPVEALTDCGKDPR